MHRQPNVLRLEPSAPSMADRQYQELQAAPGTYFSASQPNPATVQQQDIFQTPQPSGRINPFQRPSNSPLRFRSAFAKQQVARSQSPLGRLAQQTFSQPSQAVWSPSEDENMSQNIAMSQSRSASLQQQAACPYPRQRSLLPALTHTSQQQFAMQDSQPAIPMFSSSQEEQLTMTTNVARPSSAMRAGVDTASLTAAKLLDQIGHMSSIEGQVKEVREEVQALKKACERIGGAVDSVQVNAEKLDKLETAMSQIAADAAEANTKTLTELTAVKDACDEILAAVKRVADELMAHVAPAQSPGRKQTDAGTLNSGNGVAAAAAAAKTDTHGGGCKWHNSNSAARMQPTEQGPAISQGNEGARLETAQHHAGNSRTGMPRATIRADRGESRKLEPAAPWRRKHRIPTPILQQPPAAAMREGGDSAPSQSRMHRPAGEGVPSGQGPVPVTGKAKPGSRSYRLQGRPLQLALPRRDPDAPPPDSPSLHYGHPLAPDTQEVAGPAAAGAAKRTACSRAPLADKVNAAEHQRCFGGSKRPRQQSAEPLTGLSDPFAALFAKADKGDHGCGAAAAEEADTAAIDDQEIQREVKRRMLMQRMKRMRP